jgi:hypothetical protein
MTAFGDADRLFRRPHNLWLSLITGCSPVYRVSNNSPALGSEILEMIRGTDGASVDLLLHISRQILNCLLS